MREIVMKKNVLIGIIVLLSLSACVPDFLSSGSQVAPVESVDIEATVDAAASTQAVQTFAALATPTMEDVSTESTIEKTTATATATEELLPTETLTATMTETPDGTPTETATETPDGTLPAETATIEATATSIFPSPTSPIYANEVPDYIPRFKVKVRNNTNVRVYISLQGSTVGGYNPIVEYDLTPWQKVKLVVPEGRYAIIVYVGSDPMVEYIGVHSNNSVEITIKKDSLKVTK
jgi:hypothetical protein